MKKRHKKENPVMIWLAMWGVVTFFCLLINHQYYRMDNITAYCISMSDEISIAREIRIYENSVNVANIKVLRHRINNLEKIIKERK